MNKKTIIDMIENAKNINLKGNVTINGNPVVSTTVINNNTDNGYIDINPNLSLRYGILSSTTDDNGYSVINFDTPFPNKCLSIVCVDNGEGCYNFGVIEFNKTSFKVFVRNASGDIIKNGFFGCRYIAIGF